MYGLVMAAISTAMFSTIVMVALNNIPVDALIASMARAKAQEGMQALAAGSARYIKSVTDVNGVAVLPAQGTDLSEAIQPNFAFIPAAPSGMSWSISSSSYSGLPAIAICLRPVSTIDEATRRGVASVQGKFPAAAVFVNSSCEALSNGAGAHVTYWVVTDNRPGNNNNNGNGNGNGKENGNGNGKENGNGNGKENGKGNTGI